MFKNRAVNDENIAVIQLDFAENYTSQIQNAIQSSYWVSKQYLFTICAWEKHGCHSVVIASDYLSHDKYAVFTFLPLLLDYLKREVRDFTIIEIFADGAASKFKQGYTLCRITLLGININWNFFATTHGKGAVNGICGLVKREVAKTVIKNLDDFVNTAVNQCNKIVIIKCSKNR